MREIELRRSRRVRRLRLTIDPAGRVRVVAPLRTGRSEIDRFLRTHSGWIDRQIARLPTPTLGLEERGLSEADGRRLTRRLVAEIAEREAPRLGVSYARIAVRDQRTRWGSCSTSGTLSFNWRLLLAPAWVLDDVVCHELIHMWVPNHSSAFWWIFETKRPGADSRPWLRAHGGELSTYRPADSIGA